MEHLYALGDIRMPEFEVKKGSKFNMNQKDLCLVPGFHENSILKHCPGEEHSSDSPFSAISRQRPTSSVAPYNFAHEAILAVDGLQNTRINHLENKSSTWMSKKDPVSTWVSIGNQSTLDLGDNFSYLTPDWAGLRFVKDLDGNGLLILIHGLQQKLGRGQEAIPSPLAMCNQITSAVRSLLLKACIDSVWIQTPWKEADLLTTLMRIKRTRKTWSRIETDAWKVGSRKYMQQGGKKEVSKIQVTVQQRMGREHTEFTSLQYCAFFAWQPQLSQLHAKKRPSQ